MSAATVFVHWLIFQSLYVIGALCAVLHAGVGNDGPVFWYVILRNLHHGNFTRSMPATVVSAKRNHLVPATVWFLAVAA